MIFSYLYFKYMEIPPGLAAVLGSYILIALIFVGGYLERRWAPRERHLDEICLLTDPVQIREALNETRPWGSFTMLLRAGYTRNLALLEAVVELTPGAYMMRDAVAMIRIWTRDNAFPEGVRLLQRQYPMATEAALNQSRYDSLYRGETLCLKELLDGIMTLRLR
jgi:hypothetical protein